LAKYESEAGPACCIEGINMEFSRRKFIKVGAVASANLMLVKITHAGILDPLLALDQIEGSFLNPPDDAKTCCYWWWFNSLVDEAGITLDFEEFKAKGMGGVLLINTTTGFGSGEIPKGPEFLSKEWLSLYKHSLKEADRLGIELGVNLSTGWAMGGAWIKAEDSGRWFLQSKMQLSGPQKFTGKLPLPGNRDGYDNAKQLFIKNYIDLPLDQLDYKDTSVLAYQEDADGGSVLGAERSQLLPAKSNRLDASSHAEAHEVMEPTLIPWKNGTADKPIALRGIIDLTAKLRPDGVLDWEVPAGKWTILRTGHRMTGARTAYALPEAEGLEIDWLNEKGVERQFDHLGKTLIKEAGEFKKALKYFHDDSFEDGFPNWTDNILEKFKKYRGYDALPYLPVFAGMVVENAEVSDRFLYDYRKTAADCMADGHYKRFAELCHAQGLLVQSEGAGPSWSGTMCMDALKNLGRMDLPMGEFWNGKNFVQHDQNQVCKLVASAAHIYGKKKASAEAFTSFKPHWSDTPESLKPIADRAFCEGINRFVIHTSTATRAGDKKPGYEYGAGTHFNRNITWWDRADVFLGYLNRCQYLLQSGLFVADVLYYNGDWAPNLVGPKRTDPALGKGYDYDVCNSEVLLTRVAVKNKRVVLPDGMSYRVLVVPDSETMPVEVARKVRDLVRAGATIIGPKPLRDPGLKNYPKCDDEVRAIADEVWGIGGSSGGLQQFGKGRVIKGETIRNVLLKDGIGPDFEYSGEKNYIDFIHRTVKDREIYFLANRQDKEVESDCVFRVSGRKPELWDAATGKIIRTPVYKVVGNRLSVSLQFAAYGSVFVVFPQKSMQTAMTDKVVLNNQAAWLYQGRSGLNTFQELKGAWDLKFDVDWGGPAAVRFEELQDWSKHPDQRIKYYSGKAVYRKTFDTGALPSKGKSVFLDLGIVKNIATVKLNGVDKGTVWTSPWMLDISEELKQGSNLLEIEIINLWPNRLIGDAALDKEKRLTNTNIIIKKEDKLLSSGLIGPVVLKI